MMNRAFTVAKHSCSGYIFPNVVLYLQKMNSFNLHNGSAARLSYDDVFMKRMFESYIYKEENVYDRAIAEYAAGVDALMESERAKNSLLEFEGNIMGVLIYDFRKENSLQIREFFFCFRLIGIIYFCLVLKCSYDPFIPGNSGRIF